MEDGNEGREGKGRGDAGRERGRGWREGFRVEVKLKGEKEQGGRAKGCTWRVIG